MHRHIRAIRRFVTKRASRQNAIAAITFVSLIVVVLGSIGDAFSFVSEYGSSAWGMATLVLVVVGASVYAMALRPDLRIAPTTVNAPDMPTPSPHTDRTVSVDTLSNRAELGEIARLASIEFGADAMTFAEIEALHWPARDTVFLARCDGAIVGYLAMLPPTEATWERIHEPGFEPRLLCESDIDPLAAGEGLERLYIESVVVLERYRRDVWRVLLHHALESISSRFGDDVPESRLVRVCGFGISRSGVRLLSRVDRLSLNEHLDADATDWAALYSGTISVSRLRNLLRGCAERSPKGMKRPVSP